MQIDLLVEGVLDSVIGSKIVEHCGHQPGTTFGRRGIGYISNKVIGFNAATQPDRGLLVIVDFMDTRLACVGELQPNWLPHKKQTVLLRAAIREIESWLLADRESIAAFLGAPPSKVPAHPEVLQDPKQTLVNLARQYSSRDRRAAIVPAGVGQEGPEYTAELSGYVLNHWSVHRASVVAPSLNKCVVRVEQL